MPKITPRRGAGAAPEYDATKGTHLHLALHLRDTALRGLIELVEPVTGAPAERLHLPDGAVIRRNGRRLHGVVAIGDAGAWLVQKNTRPLSGGERGFLGYAQVSGRNGGQFIGICPQNARVSMEKSF